MSLHIVSTVPIVGGGTFPVVRSLGETGHPHFVTFPYVREGGEKLQVYVEHIKDRLPGGSRGQYLGCDDHHIEVYGWYGMLSPSAILMAHDVSTAIALTEAALSANKDLATAI